MKTLDYCDKGIPIFYDEEEENVIYKDNSVPYKDLKAAYDSGYDSIQLKPDLFFRKYSGIYEFGCLHLSEIKVQQLIKKVCQAKLQHRRAKKDQN